MKKIFQILILSAITSLLAISDLSAQTLMAYPAPTSGYSGNTRGYWFQAPCSFTIVGLKVPTNYSTANSYIAVVDFGTVPPPTYSVVTNTFTTLAYLTNVAGTAMIPVSLPVVSGHYIGIMGCRGSISNYAVAGPYATTINGMSTSLYRLGMQFDLTTTAPKDLWYEASTVAVVEMYYSVTNLKNDAGILAITTPTSPASPGIANVTATLKNYGKDTLKTVGLRWSVNGTTQTSPSNWSGTLAPNANTGPLTFGSYNFTAGTYNVKAWSTAPNGLLDSNAINDTARLSLISCTPGNGTYVIDPSGAGDFKTFNAAVDWLKGCGITGPVTVRVKPGTYTEQVTIPAIPGASATNTITFESYNLDSNSVNLTYAATGTADNWVLRFSGCSYVTFREMTITATGATYGRVVEFITAASYNTLQSNILQTLITTSSNYAVIYSAGTLDNYNTIKNNIISGGYYGIYWYGVSTASFELGTLIEGNTIKDFYYNGIMSYYQEASKIRKNIVTNSSTSATSYGIYAYYNRYNIEITQNNIQLNSTGTKYGMYLGNDIGTTALRGNISNNFVSVSGTSAGTAYGIYLTTVSYQDINYNSVNIAIASASTYAFYVTSGTASTVYAQNNNFINVGGGYAIYAATATSSLGTCNYNNLYSTGTNIGYYAAAQTTMAAWRTASGKDANSVNLNPGFISSTDLHVNSAGISGMGTPLSGYTVDIDDETRLNPPDIGADEFNLVANDAGVTTLVASGLMCAGPYSPVVKVKNFGTSPLTLVTVAWSVNGVRQADTTVSCALNQYQEGIVTLKPYTVANGVYYNLKCWARLPNNQTDGNARNDTLIMNNITTSFTGTYQIGGPYANFPTFSSAVAALTSRGVCGPVVFNVYPGTYSERIVIPQILGVTAANTITFNGANRNTVKLTYAGSTTTLISTVLLNGADYINFKNMTIQNTGATYGASAWLMNQANYNTFDSCNLICDTVATSSYITPIISNGLESSTVTYGNNANYTTISNCIIKGGYYGVKFSGTSYTVQCVSNSVINCTIDKVYYYGIYFYYQSYPTYRNNILKGFRTTSAYGIQNYYCLTSPTISYNTITGVSYGIYNYNYSASPCTNPQIMGNNVTALVYGLYQYYNTSSNIEGNIFNAGYSAMYITYETNPLDSSTIINNIGHQGGNPSYAYGNGLYLAYGAKVVILHNTFQTDTVYSSTVTSYGTCYIRYATGPIKVRNNIFKSYGNIPCLNSDGLNIPTGALDYNLYFCPSGNIVSYWTTNSYTSYTTWRSIVMTQNKNSLFVDPQLISKYNLHLKPTAPFYKGYPVGVPVDVDGNSRCIPSPTMGADEFIHPYSKPTADFFIDTVVCLNSPYTFLNKAGINEPYLHLWYINGVYKSTSFHYAQKFFTPGYDTVMLITQNCSSADTMTKYFRVDSTNSKPESYFIADRNLIEVNETVNFLDLSSGCPERWKWTISPDSIEDPMLGYKSITYIYTGGTSATSQFPKITFLYSGKYNICLTTYNTVDTGTTYCVNNYIEVKPSAIMCVYPFDSKEQWGTLYDEGGYNGQYMNSKTCAYAIHPCTKEVRLVFKMYDVLTGDYMRIFDGPTNKSRPLWNVLLYPQGINNINFIPSLADTFIASSGTMYIELSADASGQGNGFVANWTSDKIASIQPVASFDVPDTICNGVATVFRNTSTGSQNDNFWDYENDGYTDANTVDGINTYWADTSYDVRLMVAGCGGADTIVKKVYVRTSYASPKFEIFADNYKPNIFADVVNISENTLKNCVDSTIWDISPKSYTIVSGKLANSPSLGLKFNDTVCYDFKVIGIYHGMSDTMYYPCFIKPLLICRPVASNVSPDIGIARVALNHIDNYSDIGITEYSDYSATVRTELEIGARYNITVERRTNFNPISHRVWIDYNRDGKFNNATEVAAFSNSSNGVSWNGLLSLPKNLPQITTRMRVGTALGNTSNTPCGPNTFGEYEDYTVSFVPDKTSPVISLLGADLLHIVECSQTFIDPGVIAFDNVDTNMITKVVKTGTVDPSTPGTYYIYYNLQDAAGNIAKELKRTVIVDNETVSPDLILLGSLNDVILAYENYVDPGYQTKDTCSGMDTVIISSTLDNTKLGTYTITYKAIDHSKNFTILSRTVEVVDTLAPVIVAVSKDTILLNVYQLLPNPLYTLTDNYYKDVNVVIKGTYYETFPNGEATALGYYTFKYVFTDGSGNSDSIDFVILVVDGLKPILQLKGFFYYKICRFDSLIDPGYTVTDNFDKNPKVVKSGSYVTNYLVHRTAGNFELIYTASDVSGNSTSDLRYIYVSDQGDCYSAINNSETSAGVSLYPSLGDGKFNLIFNILTERSIKIQFYDALGNSISESEEMIKPGQEKAYDYRDLKPGMYFIRVFDGKTIISFKYNLIKL